MQLLDDKQNYRHCLRTERDLFGVGPVRMEGALMTRASGLFLMAVSHLLLAAAAEAQAVSFIARRDFGAGGTPTSVAVGDFNGDGRPDLAVANSAYNSGSNNVSVLINNTPIAKQRSNGKK